jgi:hypothetical protein
MNNAATQIKHFGSGGGGAAVIPPRQKLDSSTPARDVLPLPPFWPGTSGLLGSDSPRQLPPGHVLQRPSGILLTFQAARSSARQHEPLPYQPNSHVSDWRSRVRAAAISPGATDKLREHEPGRQPR